MRSLADTRLLIATRPRVSATAVGTVIVLGLAVGLRLDALGAKGVWPDEAYSLSEAKLPLLNHRSALAA